LGNDKNRITGTWVHAFEEDTAEGAVFRPEDADIPLSRRPRERIEIRADGSAVILVSGADDRFVPQPARWTEEAGALVVRDAQGAVRMRVVKRSADRLVVELPRRGDQR
jgi:hypothetical protein